MNKLNYSKNPNLIFMNKYFRVVNSYYAFWHFMMYSKEEKEYSKTIKNEIKC